jgi:hypothetical protein
MDSAQFSATPLDTVRLLPLCTTYFDSEATTRSDPKIVTDGKQLWALRKLAGL